MNKVFYFRLFKRSAAVLICLLMICSSFGFVFSAAEDEEPEREFTISEDEKYLYICGYNSINDAADYFDTLNEIYINNCELEDIDIIMSSKIERLIIGDTTIKKLPSEFPDTLKEITLDRSYIDLNLLKKCEIISLIGYDFYKMDYVFPACKKLTIDSCSIYSLEGIQNSRNIEKLYIFNTLIDRVDPIKYLPKLSELELDYTMVKDISCLENTKIRYIYVSNTPIESVRPMTKMKNLEIAYTNNTEMAYDKESVIYLENFMKDTYVDSEGLDRKNKIIEIAEKIITPSMTDKEKIFTVAKYVCDNLKYDYRVYENDDLNTSYGSDSLRAFFDIGLGSCMTYTTATTALLRAAGVEVIEQRSDNHIWNLCLIDGVYYCLDVTFSDNDYPLTEENLVFYEYDAAEKWSVHSEPLSIPAPMLARGDEKESAAEETEAEPVDSYSDTADRSAKNLFKEKIKALTYMINRRRNVIIIAALAAAAADAAVIAMIIKIKRKK